LHKPVRHKFKRRIVFVPGIDDTWSCDLVEMQEWAKQNKDYKYILKIVDVFSKYAWSVPLIDKKGSTAVKAFDSIIKFSNRKPKHIWVDKGKEFYNKEMDQWLKHNNINRYSTYGEHKSAVAERFNRTLKTNMWKRFTAENTRIWTDMLPTLLKNYNNKFHNSIKMTPTEASMLKNEGKVKHNLYYDKRLFSKAKPKFKLGDFVYKPNNLQN
jgi:hypothetical protein